jgi:hypothetical protein
MLRLYTFGCSTDFTLSICPNSGLVAETLRIWDKYLFLCNLLLGGNVIASTFYFSFKSSAAKRPRFDLKEKQCLREMEYDAYGRLNKFVH